MISVLNKRVGRVNELSDLAEGPCVKDACVARRGDNRVQSDCDKQLQFNRSLQLGCYQSFIVTGSS